MEIEKNILEYLKNYGSVAVPGFGIFRLKNAKAQLNVKNNSFLPPAKEISFAEDYQNSNEAFIQYFATKENLGFNEAKNRTATAVNYWKNTLLHTAEVNIEGIGKIFQTENRLAFKGNRIEDVSHDFYGLEEVSFGKISGKTTAKLPQNSDSNSYKLNKSFWWLLLLGIPVAGLIYFGITKPEIIFGKKSKLAETKELPKTKISQKKPIDTLKNDSLKTVQENVFPQN